jgi:hypothetical protein
LGLEDSDTPWDLLTMAKTAFSDAMRLASLASNWADPILAATADRGDEQIITLFGEWCTAWRATSKSQTMRNLTRQSMSPAESPSKSTDAPVQGAAGLAIKAFMVGQNTSDGAKECLDDMTAVLLMPPSGRNRRPQQTALGNRGGLLCAPERLG